MQSSIEVAKPGQNFLKRVESLWLTSIGLVSTETMGLVLLLYPAILNCWLDKQIYSAVCVEGGGEGGEGERDSAAYAVVLCSDVNIHTYIHVPM